MTNLKKIQSYVKQYAEIIGNIVGCEVEIVDEKLIRIAGTDYYEKEIDKFCEGTIYPYVFFTEQSQIVRNPKQNKLCKECKNREDCIEELEISAPIFYKGKVIGVIGLICFKRSDKKRILENLNSYLKFTEQISDFISSKIFEMEKENEKREKVEIFKQIINYYDKGVLVIDDKGNVIDANNIALKELGIDGEQVGYPKMNIIPKVEKKDGKSIYTIEINRKCLNLAGVFFNLSSITNREYKIFIFETLLKNIKTIKLDTFNEKIFLNDIIGRSDFIAELKENIRKIANSSSTVLITGESGTGKELVARAIHSYGNRSEYPFIAVNCGAIPENLLESELFGYVKGAFSGASNEGRIGKFEAANNGVIFLDEIGEMPIYLQVKLLRVLQEKRIERLGSNKSVNLNIRIVAATNANLEKLVGEKKFREDLYYRLNVINFELLPLRQRKDDIEILLSTLFKKYENIFNKKAIIISKEINEILKTYSWPGNIRELENIVEYLVNMQEEDGKLSKKTIENLKKRLKITSSKVDIEIDGELLSLGEIEKKTIKKALKKYGINKTGKDICAEKLGIGIATLYRKIEKYNLEEEIKRVE